MLVHKFSFSPIAFILDTRIPRALNRHTAFRIDIKYLPNKERIFWTILLIANIEYFDVVLKTPQSDRRKLWHLKRNVRNFQKLNDTPKAFNDFKNKQQKLMK